MIVSTRGRYALRVMLDLAASDGEEYIAMRTIAERQGISLKYLERIQGKGGGYRLTRRPEEYRVGEILRLTEGDLAPVSCLECGAEVCEKRGECPTYPMWAKLHGLINDYLDSVTIADLMGGTI